MKKSSDKSSVLWFILLISFAMIPIHHPANFTLEVTAISAETDGNYNIEINEDDESVTIIDYLGSETEVDIPSKINGYTVTKIGMKAFENKNLTKVAIPNSVKFIETDAFRENQLTHIDIPYGVESIGFNAFNRNRLESLTIPNSVTIINTGAFSENNLTSVVIPESVYTIGTSSFADNNLTSVVLSEGNTIIGEFAFSNNQLTSVIIPDSVEEIRRRAFQQNQLTSVHIPNSVSKIENGAFFNNKLSTINIHENVTSIDEFAFALNSLKKVVIRNRDTSIAENAFNGNVDHPENLTIYGYSNSTAQTFAQNKFHTFILLVKVTYDGNGATDGSVPIDHNDYIFGENDKVIVLENTGELVKTGYTFKAWNTKPDGTGDEYFAGQQFVIGSEDITLYAMWEKNKYHVTFKDFDGTALKQETVEHGQSATAPVGPIRTGYTFTGWDVTFDNITDDIVVTATYKINEYTITFNSNGGNPVANLTVKYGNALVNQPNRRKRVIRSMDGIQMMRLSKMLGILRMIQSQ